MDYIVPLFRLISKLIKKNGTLYAVKSLKGMRLHVTRYVCGNPLLVNKDFISLTKDGFPTRLLFLKELADSKSLEKRKFLFTLLMVSRTLIPKKNEIIPFSTDSITDPYKGSKYRIPTSVIKAFVKEYGLKSQVPQFSMKDLYLSLKSGPNGPATLTVLKTICFLGAAEIGGLLGLVNKDGRD
jgi:hypothetical protein